MAACMYVKLNVRMHSSLHIYSYIRIYVYAYKMNGRVSAAKKVVWYTSKLFTDICQF